MSTVPGRHRVLQHLAQRIPVQTEHSGSLPRAHPLHHAGPAHPRVQLHLVHPSLGIDRVIANMKRLETLPPFQGDVTKVLVAHVGDNAMKAGLRLSSDLRQNRVSVVLAPSGRSLKSQLRYASAVDATHAVIIGDEELSRGVLVVRDLARSEQNEVSSESAVEHLRGLASA